MATIGTFSRTENGYSGSVKTLTLNVKSVKFVAAEGDNEKGPDYRVIAAGTEFGAAWKKTSDKATTTSPSSSTTRRSRLNLCEPGGERKRGSGAHLVAPSPPTETGHQRGPRASGASSCSYPPPQDRNTASCARIVPIGCG